MKKQIWIILLFCLLLGGSLFGWYKYSADDTECTKDQIILDLKRNLNNDHRTYNINHNLDKVLAKYGVLKVNYANKHFFDPNQRNSERGLELIRFLNNNIKLESKKSFSFYILLGDVSKLPAWNLDIHNTPILMVDMEHHTYKKGEQFLVPDFYLIRRGYMKLFKKLQNKGDSLPFEDRKDVVFWRGAQTGGTFNYENKTKLPRYNLVIFSLNNPSYVDARFVGHDLQVENSDSGRKYSEHMNSLFGSNPERYITHATDHVKYKYLISLDGNVSSWERPLKIMNGRSVLLYHSNHIQFFTPYMKEGEHYVGVKEDLSDLKQKVDWLRNNPKEAERIANNGREFAERMKLKLFACYYQEVLEHIQQNFVS